MAVAWALAGCGGDGGGDPGTDGGADAGDDAGADAGSGDDRDALRAASIFENGDFEETETDGVTPVAWRCACKDEHTGVTAEAPCVTTTEGAKHGARALLLAPGCTAYQATAGFVAGQAVRFDLFARGDSLCQSYFILAGADADGQQGETIFDPPPQFVDPEAWLNLTSDLLATIGRTSVEIRLFNTNVSEGPLAVDDVVAVQDAPSPPPEVGALLEAGRYAEIDYAAAEVDGGAAGEVWVPLPIDRATQVPLYAELVVTPAEVVDSIEYATAAEGNWGAVIRLAEDGVAAPLTIEWIGVTLDRKIASAERPIYYAAEADPAIWLAATPVVDAADPGIAETAAALAAPGDSAADKAQAVLDWIAGTVGVWGDGAVIFETSQDATSVHGSLAAAELGDANLAAALGRALGVPARTVAWSVPGGTFMNAYSTEFWLGAELGWRRTLPGGSYLGAPPLHVPETIGVVLRVDGIEDEAAAANARRWAFWPGEPLNTVFEPRAGAERMTYDSASYWGGPTTLRPAVPLLAGEAVAMDDVFARARALWQADLAAYAAGGLPEERMAIRRQALDAWTLADVDAMLDQLE